MEFLNPNFFEHLLARLDADPLKAAKKYEALRLKLVKILVWKGCPESSAEELADQVFDRIAMKLEEGHEINDVSDHALKELRFTWLEFSRKHQNEHESAIDSGLVTADSVEGDTVEWAVKMAALGMAMKKLSQEDRQMIDEYYNLPSGTKRKEHLANLSTFLGTSPDKLQVKITRLRSEIEKSVEEFYRGKSETFEHPVPDYTKYYKTINVWLDERIDAPAQPLIRFEKYTLNFSVGKELNYSLIGSSQKYVPEEDIPEAGLDTDWVITAQNLGLEKVDENTSVIKTNNNGEVGFSARFSLLIPKSGEGEVRRLIVNPLDLNGCSLQIAIFAKDVLYRQFSIDLKVASDRPKTRNTKKPAISIINEMAHASAGELNPKPAHEWLTPEGRLSIVVLGEKEAYVRGFAYSATGILIKPDKFVPWFAVKDSINPKTTDLRDAAGLICDDWDGYFGNIESSDLLAKLSDSKEFGSAFIHTKYAADEHHLKWNEMAASPDLDNLAYRGYLLFNEIFPEESEIRALIDYLPQGWRIDISWTKSRGSAWIANIPWSMLYTEGLPAKGHPPDPLRFFGLRFRLNYTAFDKKLSPSVALGKYDEVYKGVCLYRNSVKNDTAEIEANWQQEQWEKMGKGLVIIPNDFSGQNVKRDLTNFLAQPEPVPMRYLYFYCFCESDNGRNPVLDFGNKVLLSQRSLGFANFTDQPLVFINACKSASGEPNVVNQLVETFFNRGCRAYLGTEVYISTKLASRFAMIFSHFFYRRITNVPVSAGESVFQTRHFLWNQYRNIGGLFYSYINEYDLFFASEVEMQQYFN